MLSVCMVFWYNPLPVNLHTFCKCSFDLCASGVNYWIQVQREVWFLSSKACLFKSSDSVFCSDWLNKFSSNFRTKAFIYVSHSICCFKCCFKPCVGLERRALGLSILFVVLLGILREVHYLSELVFVGLVDDAECSKSCWQVTSRVDKWGVTFCSHLDLGSTLVSPMEPNCMVWSTAVQSLWGFYAISHIMVQS